MGLNCFDDIFMTLHPVLDTFDLPFWARFFPSRYMFAKGSKVLRGRDPWEVFVLWQKVDIDLSFVGDVSRIIADIADWPNSLFIPNDSTQFLVSDYHGSFTDIHVWRKLESKIFYREIKCSDIRYEGCYIDFLKRCDYLRTYFKYQE